ncbi:hypothetical protein JCM5350_002346 [Sporobolomyces pararoseus]
MTATLDEFHPAPLSTDSNHSSPPREQRRKSLGPPWISSASSQLLSPIQRLDAELFDFVEWIRPSRENHRARMRTVNRFEKIVQTIWSDSRVEVFGSLATGLYLPDGDLDIVVSLPPDSTESTQDSFVSIAHSIQRYGFAATESIEVLSDIKVPLLRFSTTSTSEIGSFKLDVSLEHARDGPLGATACLDVLRGLDEVGTARSDRAKGLVFVIKTLLKAKDLASSRNGGLGGMSIFCLVISFIQHDRRPEESCSPATDLLAFLDFAAYFDYERFAISIVGKGTISPKTTQRWTDDSKPRRVCIQHPTDRERNLSCGTYKIYELQKAFGRAYDELVSLLESPRNATSAGAYSSYLEIFKRAYDPESDLDAPFYPRSPSPPVVDNLPSPPLDISLDQLHLGGEPETQVGDCDMISLD